MATWTGATANTSNFTGATKNSAVFVGLHESDTLIEYDDFSTTYNSSEENYNGNVSSNPPTWNFITEN